MVQVQLCKQLLAGPFWNGKEMTDPPALPSSPYGDRRLACIDGDGGLFVGRCYNSVSGKGQVTGRAEYLWHEEESFQIGCSGLALLMLTSAC